jgi:hypothetical protein
MNPALSENFFRLSEKRGQWAIEQDRRNARKEKQKGTVMMREAGVEPANACANRSDPSIVPGYANNHIPQIHRLN